MSERVVILGGVAPVEVVIPGPTRPSSRAVFDWLSTKLAKAQPGDKLSFTELELCAIAAALQDLDEKMRRVEKIRDILRDEPPPRRR